jgi:hypothetical protein
MRKSWGRGGRGCKIRLKEEDGEGERMKERMNKEV